ncbi:MAG: tetratricopeptide repeat protein [Hyphomicrobiaceae bacterium]
MRQVTELMRQGKYADAIPLGKRAVAGVEKAAGREHPLYATNVAMLADLYNLNGDHAKAEQLHDRALRLREKILGPNHADVAASLSNLANIYAATARYADAQTALERALRIRKQVLPKKDPNYGFTFISLGRLHFLRSQFDEAGRRFEQGLALLTRHLEPDHIYIPVAINNLAEVRKAQGRYTETEKLLRRALAINEKKHGPDSPFVSPNLNNLADLYRLLGRHGDAETLMRRELAIVESAHGPGHNRVAVSLNNLALVLTARGRPDEAQSLLQRALGMQEKALGADHPEVASTLNNLADALAWAGHKDKALVLFKRSLAIREKHFGPNDLTLAINLDNLAVVLGSQKRFAEAETFSRRSLAIREAHQHPNHPQVALSLNNLATIVDELGRTAETRQLYERALEIRMATLGHEHPQVAISLNNLGANRLDENDWQGAFEYFRKSNQIWTARFQARATLASGNASSDLNVELDRFPDSFLGFARASFRLAESSDAETVSDLSDGAFRSLQWASRTGAADAVAKMSVRIAAGTGPLAKLVREKQDLANDALAADTTLLAQISKPADTRNQKAENDLKQQVAAILKRIGKIDETLAHEFPRYAALTNPDPLSIAQTQRLLRPDEALYTIALMKAESFAWVVTASESRWVRVPLTRNEIRDHVAALRCGLDQTAWAEDKGKRCTELLNASLAANSSGPFDLARANALYRALFSQVEDVIENKKLLIVPSGPLASLPFQVLVTEAPAAAFPADQSGYADAPWLAKRHAITVLPAVANLRALRQFARNSKAAVPFLGFGNPLLTGPDGRDRSAWKRQSCAAAKPSRVAGWSVTDVLASLVLRGLADVESVRRQMPLPETTDEICAVARASNAGENAVYLGGTATEKTVKKLSADGHLARARVVHFATHGLLAGETQSATRGAAEPALILTPPDSATELDDGLLTASEIGRLKLDADWVILSACNTAHGARDGGEALSGLARAFFYAGARTALVSHWAVDSNATVKIVTGTFDHLRANPGAGRAEAMRQAMIALMQERGFYAHPAAWAPFVVVGEGAS